MTTKQAARSLKVVPRTIRRFVKAGELTPHSWRHGPNGQNLFTPSSVESLRQRRQAGRMMDDVIAGSLALLAENHPGRPLCPQCAAREVNRGGNWCTRCEEKRSVRPRWGLTDDDDYDA